MHRAADIVGATLLRTPLLVVATIVGCSAGSGSLELTVVDAASGAPTPARIELLDGAGTAHVPDAALPVAADCGWLPVHLWLPWFSRLQMSRMLDPAVPDPYSGTTQFYLHRPLRFPLPPGTYRLRAFKGIEYRVAERTFEVRRGETHGLRVALDRWVDLPAEGWHSADDHLHIPRPHRAFDDLIARWMQAEDVHVANLLQMGLAREFFITPQAGFGDAAHYRDGNTIVASGQENPRTHVLGHSIILGAREWIDFPGAYLEYDRFWRAAHEQGAITGYAHWGLGGADEGLAVWAGDGLVDFLEVLGFGLPYYGTWYDALNLGIRIVPTAGTDYPCSPSLPGRERFYTRVDGPLDYPSWIEGVRRGRTFVTNGPVLELSIDGAGIGEERVLEAPGSVTVEGRVRYDPGRDAVTALELVDGGSVVLSLPASSPGEIRFRRSLDVAATTWFALRASGTKIGETPVSGIAGLEDALTYLPRATSARLLEGPGRILPRDGDPRPSAAHTAPIYVTVAGSPPLERQPRAAEAAGRWLALLDELEARLADERIETLADFPGRGDGVGLTELRAARPALIRAIAEARGADR